MPKNTSKPVSKKSRKVEGVKTKPVKSKPPMILTLDFTLLEDARRMSFRKWKRSEADCVLSLDYPHPRNTDAILESFMAMSQVHPTVVLGRRAAARALARHDFNFIDRTKE